MNAFEQLRLVHVAPHQAFEEACASIIRATTKDASRVRVFKGDGGVDVFAGNWGEEGELQVYQIKYFPDPWGPSQKNQIRDSYRTAANNSRFVLKRWTLCVPTRLTQDDWLWLHEWAQRHGNVKLLDADKLTDLLNHPACSSVRQRMSDWGVRGFPEAGVQLNPEILVHKLDDAPLGFELVVRLTNTGTKSAHHIRATVSHSQTGCVAWRHDENWWRDTGNGVLNPRQLSAKLPVNPSETIPVLSIPFRSDTALPAWVTLRLTAEDYPASRTKATVSAAQIISGQRIVFVDAEKTQGGEASTVSEPGKPKSPAGQKLLEVILNHAVANERGLMLLPDSDVPGYLSFVANTAQPGALMSMIPQEFNGGVAELISLGWLLQPVQTGSRVNYSINPKLAQR